VLQCIEYNGNTKEGHLIQSIMVRARSKKEKLFGEGDRYLNPHLRE
jgi:hypothetical protein